MDTYQTKCPSKFHDGDLAIKRECRWCSEKMETYVFRSGQHSGEPIDRVPESYLYFLANNLPETEMGKEARKYLNADRAKNGLPTFKV
jgi:hypothetical protein